MTDEEYNIEYNTYLQKVEGRRKLRTYTIIIVIVATILTTLAPFTEINLEIWFYFHISVVILGTGAAIGVVIYPYYNPIHAPSIPEGKITTKEGSLESFNETLKVPAVLYITGPFAVFFTGLSIFLIISLDISGAIVLVIVTLFMYFILFMFGRFDVWTEDKSIKVKMGFFKETFELSEINVFRSVAIRPVGEFLGYGKRTSSDGTIGYITGAKTGIRIELKNNKKYVISTKNPQQLVNIVTGKN